MPGPEVGYFYSENGLEVTFELHCRTENPKCPALYKWHIYTCMFVEQTHSRCNVHPLRLSLEAKSRNLHSVCVYQV